MSKELCLVSASGGLDSSLTLAVLKLAGYENIIACHFNYNHRGSKSEELAIKNVCNELDIPLKIFDLSNLYKQLDTTSMLTDSNSKITTGTTEGLKTLAAWVHGRNMMFITVMATFAESQVFKHNYSKIYLLGGFLNLSESGHYVDNSEYFLDSCLNMFNFGTLIGQRIAPLYCLSNIMKHELFVMIKAFGLENVYKHTISCDRPIVRCENIRYRREKGLDSDLPGTIPVLETVADYVPCNCSKNGIPACGSGLLSYWGSKMVGMDDMKLRNYYEVDDPDYIAYIPDHIKSKFSKTPDINSILDRILLPEDKLYNLKRVLMQQQLVW